MSHGVLEDDAIDYKTIASQRIESFLHDLNQDCSKHPSVAFVSTTPGDIRRDPRTKSAIHRLSARIAALEEAESLIHQTRLVAEEELALLRARVAPISACPNEIIAKILVSTYSSALAEPVDPTKTLLSISQVSRLWRIVAIGLTQMWARIHLEWNPKQRTLWLKRSGTRLLDVHLTFDSPLPEIWEPSKLGDIFGEEDLLLHSSRWRSLSLRDSGHPIAELFLNRLVRSIDLKSLESLSLLSSTYGPHNIIANFGEHPESGSALRHLILRDTAVKALHLAVDNVVTLRLSGILEEDDPDFWARILGSSDRLERLILSRLRYEATAVGPAIPVRTHLRSLVLGNDNGRRFVRYMIQELKVPALLSLDLFLKDCTERFACEFIPMLMAFFRSSPLIQHLTIRMNRPVAIKILNALRLPHTKEALVSSENIYLPHLRCLEFQQLFYDHDETLVDEFYDELLDFLIFRSEVHWYDVESGRWRQKDGSKGLECLKLDSQLDEVASFEDFVQDLVCVPDETPRRYRFHELDGRRSDADEAETTWGDLYSVSGDDEDAGSEAED